METRVVNLYKENYDIYIGRAGKGKDGYFGNPQWEGILTREEKIDKFKDYFYNRLENDIEFKRKVHDLKGKVLGCFCKPKRCHGDTIAEYLNSLPEIKKVKFAIIGSRIFNNYEFMKETLKYFPIREIISGGAKGADLFAARYAVEHAIPLKEFLPDWNGHGKSAGFIRNEKIISNCDEVIAFWNGESKGTKHSIDIAYEKSKPVHIFWEQQQYKTLIDDEISILG